MYIYLHIYDIHIRASNIGKYTQIDCTDKYVYRLYDVLVSLRV